jgi:hypothetical protein
MSNADISRTGWIADQIPYKWDLFATEDGGQLHSGGLTLFHYGGTLSLDICELEPLIAVMQDFLTVVRLTCPHLLDKDTPPWE